MTYEFDDLKYKDSNETEGIVLKTPEDLKVWEDELSNLIPISELKKHLQMKTGNIVIFATRPKSTGSGRKVVAYRTIQQGVFYGPWGINGKLSTDTLFINHYEVLPNYRGQRISDILKYATQEYCRQNSINKYFGVIISHNKPSLKHSSRWKGIKIIGKIELFSLFGGLYKRATSWEKVKKTIENS